MEHRDRRNTETTARRSFRALSPEINSLATKTIGAAIAVHRELGPGFLEAAYEEALTLELGANGIHFERQFPIPVSYRDVQIAEYRLELVVGNLLIVELKAVEQLRPVHRAQVLSYLRAGGFDLGLLMNFNVPVLRDGIQRVIWTL
jgi:GxxExxY protein